MNTEDSDRVRAVMSGIPRLAPHAGTAAITRLGGLTNLVYRIGTGGETFVLRLPGKGTEEYINRAHEAQAAAEAARAQVSPEIIHADAKSGTMVSRFVEGAITMSPQNFKSIAGAPARAGQVFRRLHDSGAQFAFRFELFSMIDEYLKVLATKDIALPEGYRDVVKEAETIRAALGTGPLPLAACHCDPLCENFLDDGERMWLVDWEYSGMNDPMWDLADLSVEGEFSVDQEDEMIRAYFAGEPSAFDRGRIVIYKAMCDLLWTLWGLIQHANGNPADDFWRYALNRFERCKTLMATPAFVRGVAAVAGHRASPADESGAAANPAADRGSALT